MPSARRVRAHFSLPIGAALLVALMLVLGGLQYRWVGQLSEAERVQMKAGARSRSEQLAREFDREVTRAFLWLQVPHDVYRDGAWGRYAERYAQWHRAAAHAGIVQEILLAERDGKGQLGLKRFAPAAGRFEPVAWPAAYAELRERLLRFPHSADGEPPPPPSPDPFWSALPLFVAPVPVYPQGSGGERDVRIGGFTLIVFDSVALGAQLLPDLIAAHLSGDSGSDYDVWVTPRDAAGRVLYASESGAPPATGDASVGLFDLRFRDLREQDWPPVESPEGGRLDPRLAARHFSFLRRLSGLLGHEREAKWRLIAAHKSGSVDRAVAQARLRNLALSFGVLVLLAASVALIVVSTQRARHLAERQIEFVAAVSHELRTPVSVIASAGENLADGVVREAARVREYGAVVRDEARRLGREVERVLAFAASASLSRAVRHEPVPVAELVDGALGECGPLLREGGFEATSDVSAGLPSVLGDCDALRRALVNLIENAVKYSGEGRLIRVAARTARLKRQEAVALQVEDRGLGIPASERRSLFEPFFRGREAVARQIRGSGLGLCLVERIVRAHSGRIEVESEPGQGSRFTLVLPVAQEGRG